MSDNPNRFVPVWTPDGVRWVDREDMTMPPFENLAQRDFVESVCHALNGTRPAGETEALRSLNVAAAGVFKAWLDSKAQPQYPAYGFTGEIGEASPSEDFIRGIMPRMARLSGLDQYVETLGTMKPVYAALAALARYVSATRSLSVHVVIDEIERRGGVVQLAREAGLR
jgi:hypothetical protein